MRVRHGHGIEAVSRRCNRHYDPTTGAFTTPDLLDGVPGEPTEANPYHYAYNDPLNKTDPLGLRPDDDTFGGGGCYGGLCFRMNLPGGGPAPCFETDDEGNIQPELDDIVVGGPPCSIFEVTDPELQPLIGSNPATFRCWNFKIETGYTPNIDVSCRLYISRKATYAFYLGYFAPTELGGAGGNERAFFEDLCSRQINDEGITVGDVLSDALSEFDRLQGFPTGCVPYLMEVDGDVGDSLTAAVGDPTAAAATGRAEDCLILNLHVKSQGDWGGSDDHELIPGREAEVYNLQNLWVGSYVALVEHWWSVSDTTPHCRDG